MTQTPKKKRRFLRAMAWTLAILVIAGIGTAGFGWYTVQQSFPQTSGTIEVAGLGDRVTVQRNDSGVPSITASTTQDLFFAQGFVHAQDRFWEMDFRRHLTAGRLSELFGESQLGTDTFLRSLGWHEVAQQEVDALPADVRSHYEAYAQGVNAYLEQRSGAALSLEYAVLGLQNSEYRPKPWSPVDSVAWLKAMAWDLRTNIEDETARAILSQQLDADLLADLYPGYPFDKHPVIVDRDWGALATVTVDADAAESGDPHLLPTQSTRPADGATQEEEASDETATTSPLADVDALITAQGEGVGSNSWVVGGAHTTTGSPLLANDPHLGAELPSVWTQMQLRCEVVSDACPFDVSGFSFSGLPGIVIGHNSQVAWGFTNLTTDVADLYVERVHNDEYLQDGVWYTVATREEVISVAGGDDVTIQVRSTPHGPIVSGLVPDFTAIAKDPRFETDALDDIAGVPGEFEISLRWTSLDAGSTAEAIFALNLAENFEDFRAAASLFDVPAQNLIYADTAGNIGYQAPGRLPIRGAGDGWLPQPAWDSSYDWQGFVPFDELPMLYNPPSGYIVTANNAIVSNAYPYALSRDWDYGFRAARIVELLEDHLAEGPISSEDMSALQMDNQMPVAASLQRAYASLDHADERSAQALELLAAWDGQNDADSNAAAFANVLWQQITALMVQDKGVKISRDDQSRLAVVFDQQLSDPTSAWWKNAEAATVSRDELLSLAAARAVEELTDLQGSDLEQWNWGDLHALHLVHGTFGTSGIGPIEWLFNRGPYATGGGSGVVNATGWSLDGDYQTTTVPSMRMVIDAGDWDASTWIHLTGASGHAFHRHYTDQTSDWATGTTRAWPYSVESVTEAAVDTLSLVPVGD